MAIDAKFRKDFLYENKAPLTDILSDLDAIDKLAAEAKATRRKIRWNSGFVLLLGLIVLVTPVFPFGILAILAAVGLFIYSFISGRGIVSHAARVSTLRQLAQMLQQDSGARTPFTVRMDVKGTEQLLSEEPWPQRKKGKQKFFKDEWLLLEGRLLDGTEFSEKLVDLIRKRSFTNPRGKSKTKTRTRYLIELRLSYPPDVYGDMTPVEQGLRNALRTPFSATIKSVRVDPKAIALKAVVKNEPDVGQANSMLFLGAYRMLNLSRRLAAHGGAR